MDEQVERYDCFQQQTPFGEWVRYTDYAALLAERDRLKKTVEHYRDKCRSCGGTGSVPSGYDYTDRDCDTCAEAVAALLEEGT
jgi:hypothetical protein